MAAQTITITYLSGYSAGVPTSTSTAVVNVPTGIDPTLHLRNIYHSGGAWIVSAAGVQTFIPTGQFVSVSTP
jgi:hypothetical protein